jgi:hypothetical protein
MIKHLCLAFSIILCLKGNAQQKVSQPELKAEYEVPADWKVEKYFKDNWDKPAGSSICHCALSVNILKIPNNAGDFDYLHMVVYPSDKKGSADPQRGSVWQYKITHGEQGDSVKTANLKWIHYTGKLVYTGEHRFKDNIAWIYQTHKDKTYYTVYFWAKPAMLSQYKGVIDKIISGFKTL